MFRGMFLLLMEGGWEGDHIFHVLVIVSKAGEDLKWRYAY